MCSFDLTWLVTLFQKTILTLIQKFSFRPTLVMAAICYSGPVFITFYMPIIYIDLNIANKFSTDILKYNENRPIGLMQILGCIQNFYNLFKDNIKTAAFY